MTQPQEAIVNAMRKLGENSDHSSKELSDYLGYPPMMIGRQLKPLVGVNVELIRVDGINRYRLIQQP